MSMWKDKIKVKQRLEKIDFESLGDSIKWQVDRFNESLAIEVTEFIRNYLVDLSERCHNHILEVTTSMGCTTIDIYRKGFDGEKQGEMLGWVSSNSEEWHKGWCMMDFSIFQEMQHFMSELEDAISEGQLYILVEAQL